MQGYRSWFLQKGQYSRRRWLQRAAAAGAGLASAGMVACSGRGGKPSAAPGAAPQAGGPPQSGGTYSSFFMANASLDPMLHNDAGANKIASAVLSRLFRYKTGADPTIISNHDLENDLALSAESPDAVTWTFKLRPDAKFQDIPPVSAHAVEAADIKATFQRALRLPQNTLRGLLGMIDPNQIETPAADTVVFRLTYPYAPFSHLMASPDSSWILPREGSAGDYDPAKVAIGSGPFTLTNATPDVAYVFHRNPGWFEAGRPYVDGLNRPIIVDATQQLAQFSGGHLDQVSVGANDLDTMQRNNPKAALIKTPPDGRFMCVVYFPLGDPTSAFQDIRVRRALSMAIDRDAIGKAVFANQYAISLIVPPSLGKWSVPLSQLDATAQQNYRYNLAEAKTLLQAAGVLDQTFKFAYVTGSELGVFPWYQQAAPAIRNMFSAAGLKTEPVAIDFDKDFIDLGKGYAQGYYPKDTILFSTVQPRNEVDQIVFLVFDSKSTNHTAQVNDVKLDTMVANARAQVDEAERLQAYSDTQKYVAQQVYVAPVGGQYQFTMIQPRVQNYQVGSDYGDAVESFSKLWLKQ